MQNTGNLSYFNKKNIINLQSEILFREAEDDFFYFNRINLAQKKLLKAIELTPTHSKSLALCADIYFIKGNIKKALSFYLKELNYSLNKTRCLSAIANCYMVLCDYKNAIFYAEEVISSFDFKNQNIDLYLQIVEFKINSLIELKQYKNAYSTFIQAKNIIDSNSFDNILYENFELINHKLELQKKLLQSNLKIV